MSKSIYEYVRGYEESSDTVLLKDCYIVVRIDGQKFHRFSKKHDLLRPNDKRCLDLMNESARHVMKSFFPNVVIAYGQSDEFSFIIRRLSNLYRRRHNKILSLVVSSFTSAFVYYWPKYFQSDKSLPSVALQYPPAFDSRCILYPNSKLVMDYLRWRQVDCHVNNLYNTTFYALTRQYTKYTLNSDNSYKVCVDTNNDNRPNPLTPREATDRLSKTLSSDKHEIMFKDYGINYNNELEQFKKGSVLLLNISDELTKNIVKQMNPKKNAMDSSEESDIDLNQYISINHIDIIKDKFWTDHQHLLQ